MRHTIQKMESKRADYLKLAKMARESDDSIHREFFIEIADLITHFIKIANYEQYGYEEEWTKWKQQF